jgi:hypothetical protein
MWLCLKDWANQIGPKTDVRDFERTNEPCGSGWRAGTSRWSRRGTCRRTGSAPNASTGRASSRGWTRPESRSLKKVKKTKVEISIKKVKKVNAIMLFNVWIGNVFFPGSRSHLRSLKFNENQQSWIQINKVEKLNLNQQNWRSWTKICFYFVFFIKLPPICTPPIPWLDLMTHNSADGDDATRPRRQGLLLIFNWAILPQTLSASVLMDRGHVLYD